jgi:hypothetical protein
MNMSGPSMAHLARKYDKNWQVWAKAVSGNKTIPDIYSWHQIGDWKREPDRTIPDLKALLSAIETPERPIDTKSTQAKESRIPGTASSTSDSWRGTLARSAIELGRGIGSAQFHG